MRLMAMVMVIMAAAARTRAAETSVARNVTVCMNPGGDLVTVHAAEKMASQIFAEIGVAIQWDRMRQCPLKDAILVSLLTETPAGQPLLTLAKAFPYEGTHIMVFFDRVKSTVKPGLVIPLLAYVLAHEITHILEGTYSHSETGIMKARWDIGDYFQMRRRRLRFSEEDIFLVYEGLGSRHAAAHAPAIATTLIGGPE